MKKKVIALLLAASIVSTAFSGCTGEQDASAETETAENKNTEGAEEEAAEPEVVEVENAYVDAIDDGQVLVPVKSYTSGEGLGAENEIEETGYDQENGLVTALGAGTVVEYVVPDGTEGTYDMYLKVSKSLAASSTMPFLFSLNGGDAFSVPIDYEISGDSPAANEFEGEYDTGSITEAGWFPISAGLELEAGDTISLSAVYGSRAGMLKAMTFPYVGNILLAPAGSEVATDYDNTVRSAEAVDESDPLSGLKIIWLGSSVTLGAQSGGRYSMADYIEDMHPATVCEKYAINGTRLVNEQEDSYVARMKTISKDAAPDLFVVQLSTNDATTNRELGALSDSTDPADFDDTTIYGAIETIIAYVQETYGCPVVFYTGSYFESEEYDNMISALLEIQEKWGIGVLDMFHNEEMTALYGTDQYYEYMGEDGIHPTRLGYTEWWGPQFEQYLSEYITANAVE